MTFWVFYSLGFGPFEHHIYIHENDNKLSYSQSRRIIAIDKLIKSDKNSQMRVIKIWVFQFLNNNHTPMLCLNKNLVHKLLGSIHTNFRMSWFSAPELK